MVFAVKFCGRIHLSLGSPQGSFDESSLRWHIKTERPHLEILTNALAERCKQRWRFRVIQFILRSSLSNCSWKESCTSSYREKMRGVMNTQNAQMANEMVLAEDEPYDLDGGPSLFSPFSGLRAMKLGSVSADDQPHRKQEIMEIQKFPNKMVLNKSSMCQENAEMHYRGLHQVCLPWHTREHCRHRECANQVE